MIELLIVILLILLLIGALPAWPHSRNFGYAPSALITVLLIILIIYILF